MTKQEQNSFTTCHNYLTSDILEEKKKATPQTICIEFISVFASEVSATWELQLRQGSSQKKAPFSRFYLQYIKDGSYVRPSVDK